MMLGTGIGLIHIAAVILQVQAKQMKQKNSFHVLEVGTCRLFYVLFNGQYGHFSVLGSSFNRQQVVRL